jgi:hypothetical protein
VIPEILLDRARDRCRQHRDINGFCPCCLEYVLAAALVEENPGLCMDDAVGVVSEWIMGAGSGVH